MLFCFHLMIILDASVFPDPDSPEITMQVSRPALFIVLYAASAMAKMCGGLSKISLPCKGTIHLHQCPVIANPTYLILIDIGLVVQFHFFIGVNADAHLANVGVDESILEPYHWIINWIIANINQLLITWSRGWTRSCPCPPWAGGQSPPRPLLCCCTLLFVRVVRNLRTSLKKVMRLCDDRKNNIVVIYRSRTKRKSKIFYSKKSTDTRHIFWVCFPLKKSCETTGILLFESAKFAIETKITR